jgi:hypothetical protein
VGTLVGAGVGALDPTLGVGTLAVIGGIAGGTGDLLTQAVNNYGTCKSINWGSTVGAVAGGAISGAGGAALGILGPLAGLAEVPTTIGAAAITSPPAVILPLVGEHLWPEGDDNGSNSATSGRKGGNGGSGCH